MTAFKAKVKAVYPAARCAQYTDQWRVFNPIFAIGRGKTAFAAWVDAWRNIEAKIS